MQKEFWLQRWQNQQIGFHQDDINPYLLKYWPEIVSNEGSRVFVPLSGKSKDLLWLADQGFEVIGIEFSQLAVENFFQEHNLIYDKFSSGRLNSYKSGNITLFQGDFFDLTKEILGPVSAIFDRASMVALPESMRETYSQHLRLLAGSAMMLLVSMEYNQQQMQGPPFSVDESEIKKYYSADSDIIHLESVDMLAESTRFKERGLKFLNEKIYQISFHSVENRNKANNG